jgi:pectate lyase
MRRLLILSIVWLLIACGASRKNTQAQNAPSENLAFPGAEGYGRLTPGGRGGRVILVSNLNDNGAGSFRQAVSAKGPRIVVFNVSGTIHLESPLRILSDVTIAGQSAPGGGICLADFPVSLGGNNIIVRYIRFRMGDKNQKGGMVNGNGGDDAFGGTRRNNIIIDHCSLSWSTDEVFSVYAGDSTTLQWNLIAEPLNYSYHFETGDKDYEHHGYGAIWGGKHLSAHHNLFAHCNSRTPRFDGIRNSPIENVDYRNNVIYDWGENNVYAGEGGNYNIVNNYYKWGPSTKESVKYRIVNPYKRDPDIPFGKFYLNGNYVDGSTEMTNNNWLGMILNKGIESEATEAKLQSPFAAPAIRLQSAHSAYDDVLSNVGATLPKRDTLDERIIREVKSRTGKLIDVQGNYPHGTDYSVTINAWPNLAGGNAPPDTDMDGMPDEWEKKNGLNISDATDASRYTLNKQYTNVEVYLNSLVKVPTF